MTALFSKPKQPKIPTLSDDDIEKERLRQLAEQKGGGRSGTILTGGAGVSGPILGSSANLAGGVG